MKEIIKNNIFVIILFFTVFIKLYFDLKKSDSLLDEMREDKKLTLATITKVEYFGNSNTRISYIYEVGKNKYNGEYISRNISISIESKLINKKIPLIYSEVKPSHCVLLIQKKNFELFNLAFPDSLKWIGEQYQKTY